MAEGDEILRSGADEVVTGTDKEKEEVATEDLEI